MIHSHIESATKIGIFTHVNSDGDALGSSLGLAGYLESLGKSFRIFLPSPVNDSLSFIVPEDMKDKISVWMAENLDQLKEEVKSCDLLIGLDFNALDRIGNNKELFADADAYKILIDHHLNPERDSFDEVYSKTETSSTCEFLYYILKEMPEIGGDASKMTKLTRDSLLTGMTTDTNNFANSVFPTTLQMASELLAAGTDRDSIIQKLFFSYPLRRLQAQGFILDRMVKFTPQGVAFFVLDRRIQKRFGLQEGDTEGFVNMPLAIEGIRMSIMLKQEMSGNKVRVSIRSKKGTSAQQCAAQCFHGGGHENASGGKLIIGEDIKNIKEGEVYIKNVIKDFFD